jgi:hypothetical protein
LFTELFASFTVLPIDILVIDLAISLRQQRRLGLGNSIIAATDGVNSRFTPRNP